MRNLRDSPVPRVAILVETSRSYTRDILSGVRRYLERHGPWSTFMELRAFESPVPPWLENWDGDGILTRTNSVEMAESISAAARAGVSVVELRSPKFLGSEFADRVPYVGMDNRLIGQTVADHFLNRGYRRFAAYRLSHETFFEERVRNFVSHLGSRNHECEVREAPDDASPVDWEKHQGDLTRWLLSLEKPIGIFAANDQSGVRLLDACRRAGIAVPEEVAVVGCENEKSLCEFASPTLTSVEFDGETVGFQAASTLDRLMAMRPVSDTPILIPPKGIVVRASSDEFVIEDPIALRAVRIIRESAFLGISVGEICTRLGVSRSTLERRMKASLRRGAKEELLRVRFREVNRLLRNTDLTVETIAEATGFRHAHYLHSTYRDRYSTTPGEYRRREQSRVN